MRDLVPKNYVTQTPPARKPEVGKNILLTGAATTLDEIIGAYEQAKTTKNLSSAQLALTNLYQGYQRDNHKVKGEVNLFRFINPPF